MLLKFYQVDTCSLSILVYESHDYIDEYERSYIFESMDKISYQILKHFRFGDGQGALMVTHII